MRVIKLTDKPSGKEIFVSAGQIKMLEDATDGGTHLIFGADMGRVVVETKEQIFTALGVIPVTTIPLV